MAKEEDASTSIADYVETPAESGSEIKPSDQTAEPASEETTGEDTRADEQEIASAIAARKAELESLNKAVADTQSSLKMSQREFHEMRGEMKALREQQQYADPEKLREQREQMAERFGITTEAIEYMENLVMGQQRYYEEKLTEVQRNAESKFDSIHPAYLARKDQVEKLKDLPMFKDKSPTAIAMEIEALESAGVIPKVPTVQDPPKPPAKPAGAKASTTSTSKSKFSDREQAFIDAVDKAVGDENSLLG